MARPHLLAFSRIQVVGAPLSNAGEIRGRAGDVPVRRAAPAVLLYAAARNPALPKRVKVHRDRAGSVARPTIGVQPALPAAVEWVKVWQDRAEALREN